MRRSRASLTERCKDCERHLETLTDVEQQVQRERGEAPHQRARRDPPFSL